MTFFNNWNMGKTIAVVVTLFMATTVYFVLQAMKIDVELVSSDYYQREIEYDKQIARQLNAQKAGYYVRHDIENNQIYLQFPADLVNEEVRGNIHFYAPSTVHHDFNVAINLDSNNRQSFDLDRLQYAGFWRVKILWSDQNKEYYNEVQVKL